MKNKTRLLVETMKRKTKEELIKEQVKFHDRIRKQLNLNIVDCGNCGATIVHKRKVDDVTCPDCLETMEVSVCPDIYYKEMLKGN